MIVSPQVLPRAVVAVRMLPRLLPLTAAMTLTLLVVWTVAIAA